MFEHSRGRYALATFALSEVRICDLDDAPTLVRLGLKPTDVITRTRAVSQAWSRVIFSERRWTGVSWWSYYLPEWANVALWDTAGLELERVEELNVASPDVRTAARALTRVTA